MFNAKLMLPFITLFSIAFFFFARQLAAHEVIKLLFTGLP